MLKIIKEIFEICKELFIGFFSLVNDSIENDNLLDAFLMLFLGGMLFGGFIILVIVIVLAIINCPCVLFFLSIPFLPFVYIWWMKRRIKNKKESDE
jgi:hypothetical protein